jgi:hypothetical protein
MVPYVKALEACHTSRVADHLTMEKAAETACYALNLKEVRRQKEQFADMETRLMVLTQGFTTHNLGDVDEEEAAPRHSSKKVTENHNEPQPSPVTAPSHAYKSTARISTTSNKRAQLSSPAAHYSAASSRRPRSPADDESGSRLTAYFEPGGGAQQAVDNGESFSS